MSWVVENSPAGHVEQNRQFLTDARPVAPRILIYASLGRYAAKEEAEMMAGYGIRDVACDSLPRGVIVGSVDPRPIGHVQSRVRQATSGCPACPERLLRRPSSEALGRMFRQGWP